MITPMASIFGSGFLVIVPILVGALGPGAPVAMAIVGGVALLVGTIVRHNMKCAEPALRAGTNRTALLFEQASSVALVIAYVVAVCLYLHILSAFVLDGLGLASELNKSALTTALIVLITAAGLGGGLAPLERMEGFALLITLGVLGLLLVVFGVYDLRAALSAPGLQLPETPDRPAWEVVRIVAGTLIVVQGFETPRYLGESFDLETRIRASRWSQYVSMLIYVAFVAAALPITPVLEGVYDEGSLIAVARAAAVFLPLPLIIAAALSQFSAAVADTVAAGANIGEISRGVVSVRLGYLGVGAAAIALAWTCTPMEIVALASRAFAFYYLMQCVVAFAVCGHHFERVRFVVTGAVLLFVLVFAIPVG